MSDWFQAEQAAERAHQYYENGQWDKALAELDQALAVNPNQSEWHFGKGLALDAMQRYHEAAEAYEHVIRLRGEDPEVMLHLGVDLLRSGQPERCVQILSRLTELDADDDEPFCHLILAHALLGEHDQAEEAFYRCLQLADDNPLAYDHIAQSLLLREEYERAAWCWEQALQLDPHHRGAYGNLARVRWLEGRLDQARDLYVRQLREEPGDIDTLLQFGTLLQLTGHAAEAREKFCRVIELDPTVGQAHASLGILALNSGHLDAAAGELEVAAQLDPECPGIRLALARVAYRRNQPHLARRHLNAELALDGQTPSQVIDMARLLVDLDRYEDALDLLDPTLTTTDGPFYDSPPQYAAALLCRGVAALRLGQREPGIADLRLAVRLQPNHSLTIYNLALAYLDSGCYRRAACWIRRGLRAHPHDESLQLLSHHLTRARVTQRLHGALRRVLGLLGRGSRHFQPRH